MPDFRPRLDTLEDTILGTEGQGGLERGMLHPEFRGKCTLEMVAGPM